ncbi:GspH/FimT family protein [Paracraurococcus ruber]|uniref:Type II secretion system protein H n=1 Tax=Paracraurococcus ruber TaxID=77675 RepID=A0ABS1D7Z4_9PROT|nr:GspH/FimT family protein [Paracraurococcus ruber]MBK1662686.1 hypothetical protein [Paracraurococcus ruber]TDG06479.1 prepilin-type N-terminal cleavage/methylation domain-containing protein [Paracraurococcus ruber]
MRAPGFTLIETLAVLLVAALAATALPRLAGAGQGGIARAAVEQVAAVLREARMEARASGRPAQVVLDTRDGLLHPARGGRRALPAGAALLVEGAAVAADDAGRIAIRFDPEGGSTGGRVVVAVGPARAAVAVDWMTGHVR